MPRGLVLAAEAACPKGISVDFIAKLNRDYALAAFRTKLLGAPEVVDSAA